MVNQFPQHHIWKRPFFFFSQSASSHLYWVRKIPSSRKWQPASVFLPGKFHGQRSLVGYSPWGCKESDMMKQQSPRAHKLPVFYAKCISLQALFCCYGLSISVPVPHVVTASAKTLPTPSPGTYWDLVSSCQPFSCSQGFGAPDRLPNTLPSLHFPKGPGVQESQSAGGRGSPRPCWSGGTGPHRPEHTRLLQGWGHEEVSHCPRLGRTW